MNFSPFAKTLILTGPTGSGKSSLALDLVEQFPAEIIAVDSMTLYRGMDIGTAKPTVADRERIPHHLIDVLDPAESANVAWWLEQATRIVGEIEGRGNLALFVGGTPFYLKALLCGLFDAPPADEHLRRILEQEAERDRGAFHERLKSVDPVAAQRLHVNDVRRVVRAMEVWQLTGRTLTHWQQQDWFNASRPRFSSESCLALDVPREELVRRIEQRIDSMFAAGWVAEVEALRQQPWSREASQALGYREIVAMLEGRSSLPETVAEIKLRTRQFAKRQLTWFRSLPGCEFANAKLTFERWKERMTRVRNER